MAFITSMQWIANFSGLFTNVLYPVAESSFTLRFGLVSLFNGISTFVGLLIPKPFS